MKGTIPLRQVSLVHTGFRGRPLVWRAEQDPLAWLKVLCQLICGGRDGRAAAGHGHCEQLLAICKQQERAVELLG